MSENNRRAKYYELTAGGGNGCERRPGLEPPGSCNRRCSQGATGGSMKLLSSIRTFLAFVFHRPRMEQEMEEDLRSHLRSRADDLESEGLSRAETERRARIDFGGYQGYK